MSINAPSKPANAIISITAGSANPTWLTMASPPSRITHLTRFSFMAPPGVRSPVGLAVWIECLKPMARWSVVTPTAAEGEIVRVYRRTGGMWRSTLSPRETSPGALTEAYTPK